MDASPQYTDLLLIGKTGNGKSSTGNSILGRKVFVCAASPTSVTSEVQIEYSEICGRIIKVVDGPGVCDTDLSQEEALKVVIEAMKYATAANPRGYHAMLLVVKYGGRFTNEDNQAVQLLKGIFGPDFVEKCAILVVTHGDMFDREEDGVGTFEDWCAIQTGTFKYLLNECRNRVILFDNRTKNPAKLNEQRQQLLRMVDNLSSQGLRYTDEHFRMAERERDRLMLEAKVPMIREETMMEASLIIQQLGQVSLKEPERQLDKLNHLKERASILLQSINHQDKGTGVLNNLKRNAENIILSVDGQIQSSKRALEIQEQKKQLAIEVEALKAQEDLSRQQCQEEAQQEAGAKIAELQNEIKTIETRYAELLEHVRQSNQRVENEYHTVAVAQNEGILSLIIQAITFFLPQVISFFKK